MQLTNDAKAGILSLLIALGLLLASFYGTDIEVYLFPRIAAVLITLLSVIYLISLWRQGAVTALEVSAEIQWKRLWPALLVMVAYLISLEYLGFYTASVLAFLVICLLYGKRGPLNPQAFVFKLCVAGAFMAVAYGVFWVLLHVRTPTGWLI